MALSANIRGTRESDRTAWASNYTFMTDDPGWKIGNMSTSPDNLGQRDFNYKNLQSNFVTRWEYRPGSAIYFVWSHSQRKDDEMNPLAPWGESLYEQSLGTQISDLLRVFPGNSLMIKIDYSFH